MWLGPITQMLALAAAGFQAQTGSPAADEAIPEPIATRQMTFAIPFRIEQTDQPSRQPVEVQLSVSSDRGKSWHLHGRVDPAKRHFIFGARDDGEYWFRLGTRDRSGAVRPEQTGVPAAPGLVVIVDTVPPKLQLEAVRGEAGQIIAQWQIYEPHPDLDSLTIQYRTTSDGPWQEVAVNRGEVGGSRVVRTGKVTWWPQADSGQMQIRGELVDTAGNPAVSHALVNLTPPRPSPTAVRPDPSQTVAKDPLGPWRPVKPDGQSVVAPNIATAGRQTQPPQHLLTKGPQSGSRYSEPVEKTYPAWQYPSPGVAEASPQDRRVEPKGPFDDPVPGLPPGQQPRMVNSRLFELAYDDRSIGPPATTRVELWRTADGGTSWSSFALDEDNRSPLTTTVDKEGIYGFRIVVLDGSGLGDRPPQSGDSPEIWIGVDVTQPTARITAASPDSGKLIISWQAEDTMLAARPVTLLFSDSPGGPWSTVAAELENTGRYAWPVDARVPRAIYLRLEVRDEAGNVGIFETNQSVAVDRTNPATRIRDVRPVGRSATIPSRRY